MILNSVDLDACCEQVDFTFLTMNHTRKPQVISIYILVCVVSGGWTLRPPGEDAIPNAEVDNYARGKRDQGSTLSVTNDDKDVKFQVVVPQPAKTKFTKTIAFDPTWESIDARPLPAWYDESKVGIFIHWGVFSVPGFRSEWFWYNWKFYESPDVVKFMNDNYPPGFTYADFGKDFTAEFYNATYWAELFKKSGARYVVLTSKHHEGYTLWPSKYSFSWNAQDVGAHRDLLGELATAIRNNTDLKFGLYHSLYEWFNPLWMADKANNLTTDDFVKFKTMPELYELVHAYQPEIVWSDGEWEAGDDYWKSKEFLAWLYNESPVKDTVVTNDRWGGDTLCKHGGYYTCADRYNPGVLQPHKWENCMTLDERSWGYRRNAKYSDYLTPHELMKTLIETVSCGGNLLVNVGPTKDGVIVPIQEERLLQMGEWLEINGEAIYNSDPWVAQNDTLTSGAWYTVSKDKSKVYVMLTFWPTTGQVQLASVNSTIVNTLQVLGSTGTVTWSPATPGITVRLPPLESVSSKWAYTIVIHTKSSTSSDP